MCLTKIMRANIVFLSFLLFSCHSVAATKYGGKWFDNASDNVRVGNIEITDNKFTIINKVAYTVSKVIPNGKSEIYKISNVNKTPDPMGCGPKGKVNYIIISPLAPPAGMTQSGIYVYFYGGPTQPSIKTLDDLPGVCAVGTFRKNE